MSSKTVSRTMMTLLLLSTLALVFSIRPVSAAPTTVSVDYYGSPNVVGLTPGTEFSINITVDYVEKLGAYQFELYFNPEVLQGVSYEDGSFLGSTGWPVHFILGKGFDNENGKLWLFAGYLDFWAVWPTGGGTLATITFEVVGVGASPITLGGNSALFYKGGYMYKRDYPGSFIDGSFANSPSEVTQQLVEVIETMNLPTGTESSLTSKLDAAIDLLDQGNENGAIHKLMDFINQVEAKRGKKLTDEQADSLISAAQSIIDLING